MAPRFSAIPARAVMDDQLSHAELRVLAALCLHSDRQGHGVFAAPKTLMTESTVGRTAFFRGLRNLTELGYIEREKGRPKRRNGQYRVIQDTPRVPGKELDAARDGSVGVPEKELGSDVQGTVECRETSLRSLNTHLNTSTNGGRPTSAQSLVAPQSPLERQNAAAILRTVRVLEAANG